MFVEERRRKILDALAIEKRVYVNELSRRFAVSAATLRSDLREMEAEGLLRRTHGGAVPVDSQVDDEPSGRTALAHAEEKRAIAARAAEMVADGDVIFLDSGSTVAELVHALAGKRGLTVVTNDLQAALIADEELVHCDVVILGGSVRPRFHFVSGAMALSAASRFNVSLGFFGTTGLTVDRGFSVSTADGAELKRVLFERSARRIVLADSTKFGSNAAVSYAAFTEADVLVTDAGLSEATRNAIEGMKGAPRLVLAGA